MLIARLTKANASSGDVVAFFDVKVSGFRINGFKLRRGKEGADDYYITPPARLGNDKKWHPVVYCINDRTRAELLKMAIDALKGNIESESITSQETATVIPQTPAPFGKSVKRSGSELTGEDKIAISRKYIPEGWVPNAGIKKMTGNRFSDMRKRSRGLE